MTIDARVEMFYGGIWNDVTADVRYRQGISIDYGQPDWTSTADPTKCSLTLNNAAAKYSPLDPNSALFGKIGMGTPLRVRLGARSNDHLRLPGADGSYASTPDHASLDITGDIDMQIECEPESWRPDGVTGIARKYRTTGDQRSWAWFIEPGGALAARWSPDGTFGNSISVSSTAVIPEASGRLAIRWTLDVNNGAAGKDVKFHTAPSINGPWTQLGATVTQAGVTSVFASTAEVELGRTAGPGMTGIGSDPLVGRIYAFELRNGIDGIVVANPDFGGHEPGTTEFIDAAGRAWTVNGNGYFPDPSLRASVSAVSWKPAWDETANDVIQSIEAAGVLKRLGQGQEPLRSSLFRDLSTKDDVVAYWPLEDGSDATTFASGRQGDTSILRTTGEVSPANFDGFVASAPIPTIDAGFIQGTIPRYTGAANQRLFFLVHVPEAGVAGDRLLTLLTTGNPFTRWDVVLQPDGDVFFRAFNDDDVLLFSSDVFTGNINGKLVMFSVLLSQVGANIDWQVSSFTVGDTFGAIHESGTLAGRTFDRFRTVQLGTTVDSAGSAYGHATILNDDVHSIWDLIGSSLVAWSGETTTARMSRLATEEGVPLQLDGTGGVLLGPQRRETFLALLDEAAEADMGILAGARDALALRYRTRDSLYNQAAALTLDMANGVIVNPFDPPLDDQRVRNDVTVSRVDGSSARAVQETGPLSIQDPPDGIGGRYKDSPTLNVHSDAQLASQAGWRLHLGTVDEHRIASLEIVMERHPELQQAVLELQAGDLIRITNPVAGLPPGPLDLIALGWSEQITPHRWRLTINCEPGSPWTVGEVSDGTDEQRVDTDGSELNAGITAVASTMNVRTTSGPKWTEAAGEFPFDVLVGGERMTVTAIPGFPTPPPGTQNFTVTRSVNGVVKAHSAGSDVRLAHPMIVAL